MLFLDPRGESKGSNLSGPRHRTVPKTLQENQLVIHRGSLEEAGAEKVEFNVSLKESCGLLQAIGLCKDSNQLMINNWNKKSTNEFICIPV